MDPTEYTAIQVMYLLVDILSSEKRLLDGVPIVCISTLDSGETTMQLQGGF